MRNRSRGILLGVFMAAVVSGAMFAFVKHDHDAHGGVHPYCESFVRRSEQCDSATHGHFSSFQYAQEQCRTLGDDDDFEPLARCAAKRSCLDFAECALAELDKLPRD